MFNIHLKTINNCNTFPKVLSKVIGHSFHELWTLGPMDKKGYSGVQVIYPFMNIP